MDSRIKKLRRYDKNTRKVLNWRFVTAKNMHFEIILTWIQTPAQATFAHLNVFMSEPQRPLSTSGCYYMVEPVVRGKRVTRGEQCASAWIVALSFMAVKAKEGIF